jgi:hypothetical protein
MPEPFSATAPIKSLSGTATNPGVSFTGDEDTGLYRSGANELAVTVGGAEAAKFTATGMEIDGDISLDDGGTYTTTLQTITPTAARTISFPDATGTVALVGGSSGQLVYNNAGANAGVPSSVVGSTGNITLSLNGALSATGIAGVPVAVTGTWIATGGTATTTKPQVLIEPTGTSSGAWSTSGTGLGVNAASGFAGSLLDLQVNGTRVASVSSGGGLTATGLSNLGSNLTGGANLIGGAYTTISSIIGISLSWAGPGILGVISTGTIGFASISTDARGGLDAVLARDAANTLAQRNGTNAQTFRCYGTYTDASNYVRAALSSSSTAVTLAAETAGTGADDIPLNLTAAGTGTVKVNSVAEVVVSSTVAGLPAAPVVGMLTRVTDATAPAMGSTVAGGGAAAALCWYNGANWSVIGV